MYGLPKPSARSIPCEICLRRKQSIISFVAEVPKRSRDALEIMHFIICGSFEVLSLGGS